MKWSIGTKILCGYLFALVLLGAIGVVSYVSVRQFTAASSVQTEVRETLTGLDQILQGVVDAETSQRGFLLTGQDEYLRPYEAAQADTKVAFAKLDKLVADSSEQQVRLRNLKELVEKRIVYMGESIPLLRNGQPTAGEIDARLGAGKAIMDSLRSLVAEMYDSELRQLEASTAKAEAGARHLELIILAGTPLAGCILLMVGIVVARGISRPLGEITRAAEQIASGDPAVKLPPAAGHGDEVGRLTDSFQRMSVVLGEVAAVNTRIAQGDLTATVTPQSPADTFGNAHRQMIEKLSLLVGAVQRAGLQVNTSATEIAATSKQQQATAAEIAATTTEIGATSREIAATSKELVRTVGEVTRVADETAELAGSGQNGLGRMEATMRHIMDAAGTISGKLAVLNEKATNINAVVVTITKVADQTNLLSLNAAIEAEKAGEYGLGFAVVATEIRRLADQTAVATYDIEQMVKEMQSAVSAGVMGMDKFSEEVRRGVDEVRQVGAQLTRIIQQVQALTPRFEAVDEGMQSQSTGAQQITEALSQLSESARQTADSLRNSSIAIEHLNEAARDLQSGVARFKLKA